MSDEPLVCRTCSEPIDPAHRFCESCGAALSEVKQVAVPRRGLAGDGPCTECGNAEHVDDYCAKCGHKRREPDRDELEVDGIVLISDRGITHTSNEDAGAAGTVVGASGGVPLIAAVVCDGVSSAPNSAAASSAATQVAVTAMLNALGAGKPAGAAVLAGLTDAAKAAADARTDPAAIAPSCTFTGVTVVPGADGGIEITSGNVGDSRAYWLPDPPGEPEQLTLDDSLSRELIAAGADPNADIVKRGEHTLTRWLGADAEPQPWADDTVKAVTAKGPGTVLLCSDGLWNYLPEAADLAQRCTGVEPIAAARALVEYALQSGGHDNITVVLIPIGGPNA